jgi:hypothetical protein
LGLHPADVRAPDVDETPRKGELPRSYCNRITASKAEALPAAADEVILCADTTVALGRRIMGKPADRDEARAFLQKLSGRRHKVITAVAVKTTERIWQKDVVSTVQMKRLSPQELELPHPLQQNPTINLSPSHHVEICPVFLPILCDNQCRNFFIYIPCFVLVWTTVGLICVRACSNSDSCNPSANLTA